MVFSSLPFVLGFLPIFFLCYYLIPCCHKNWELLLGSVVFYALGTTKPPGHLVLLLIAIMVNYFAARAMEYFPKLKSPIFFISVAHMQDEGKYMEETGNSLLMFVLAIGLATVITALSVGVGNVLHKGRLIEKLVYG